MKLTWFGGTAIRVHIGGKMIVADPGTARKGVDPAELVSGADRVFEINGSARSLPEIDPAHWHRRKTLRPIDEQGGTQPVDVLLIGPGAVLIEAVGEPFVILVTAAAPHFGRWADDAVVVLLGSGQHVAAIGTTLLELARPRLVALADDAEAVDDAVEDLRKHLNGVALVVLEPRLAVEV